MNYSLHIIAELIEHLIRFEKETGKEPKDVKEFTIWLTQFVFEQHHSLESGHDKDDIDMEMTFLLIMQSKHYKTYCKEALISTDINSPDEYSFLYHLSLVDSFRKMELIHIHLLEAPSGIEVIKRLLKKNFIEEFDDEEDKRAKRVRITEKGRKETDKLTPKMKDVYSKMTAKMSLKEKIHIISFLRRLNDYHLASTEKKK
ncbi:MarR family winged helix-turn-helix transcriptional regulator [Saccharicrinis sp. FJH54]|uniref:MarR family winged helix-turn-helix transcriptional regulator n=1 Tax=Saccharicrinis sp. FJH54 TaxID=3344665 RepID=UPI0035D40E42